MDHYFPTQSQEPIPPADMASRAALYTGEYYNSRSDFTGIEKIMNLLEPTKARVDKEGYVLIGSKKYVEVSPGILQSLTNRGSEAALTTDKSGQAYLIANAPSALIKASWYQTQSFHLSVLSISLLFLLITLISWMISFVRALIKRQPRQLLLARLARVIGAVFVVLLLAFIAGFIVLISDVEPVSEIPLFMLEAPTFLPVVFSIPPILAVVGTALLAFTLLAWVKGFWSFRGRLQYTLLTLAAWATLWELAYWNFLKI